MPRRLGILSLTWDFLGKLLRVATTRGWNTVFMYLPRQLFYHKISPHLRDPRTSWPLGKASTTSATCASNKPMRKFKAYSSCLYSVHFHKLLYFEWSPPWHVGWRLSGEGCHWEYDGKNGEFENIEFRFPWLSDTSEMGFGHDVPFLNYSDRLPHPSDLCHPDRVRWG